MKQLIFSVCAAALFLTVQARAFTTISIGAQQAGTNGGQITTLATDGGTGSAVFAGLFGTFNFNTITAQGAPLLPSGSLSTTSIQTSSLNAGTVGIYITQQGLMAPQGSTQFLTSFTSNLFAGSAVSVVESTFFSPTNAIYAGDPLASMTFGGIGMGWTPTGVNVTGTYSETIRYLITVGPGYSSVNDTVNLTAVTPEPTSLILCGTGMTMLGAALVRRRRVSNSLAL